MRHASIIAAVLLCFLAVAIHEGKIAQASPASLPAAQAQACTANGARVDFSWVSSGDGQQWLDLSLVDGFRPGTFISVGPFAAGSNRFVWDGITSGRLHYARINTFTASGWEASETSVFTTQTCGSAQPAQLAPARAVYCDAATLQWAPSEPQGTVQWLDLSLGASFAPGTYVSAGPLNATTSSFFWTGLRPGSTHYWRVNTWDGSRWLASATGSFRTGCAAPAPPSQPDRPNGCHPSYQGACLRIGAGDYDCAGGSGNGPNYTGFVIVVGPDVFDLDRDGDGVGCE